MTTRLASLLVQDRIVPAERMTLAFERQAIVECALDTILLEMDLVDERVLVEYLARASGLKPMSALPAQDAASLGRVLTPSLAERYGVVPVVREGRAMQVLAKVDVESAQLDRLAKLLDLVLDPRVAPELRFLQARQQVYGTPLSTRHAALLTRLRTRYQPPVADGRTLRPIVPLATALESTQRMEIVEPIDDDVTPPDGVMVGEDTVHVIVAEPEDELPAAPAPVETEDERTDREAAPPAPIPLLSPETTAVVETGEPVPPLALEEGWRALDEAQQRDEVFAALCRMGRTRFSFVALFGIHGGEAQVHMALGERWLESHGLSRIVIPLDHPCSLVVTVKTRAPYLGHPGATAPMTEVMARLGREPTVWGALLPVVLKDRTVAVLYGDAEGRELDAALLGDLVRAAARTSQALQRIILRTKVGRTRPPRKTGRHAVPKAAPAEPTSRVALDELPTLAEVAKQVFDADLSVRRAALTCLVRLRPSNELSVLVRSWRKDLDDSDELRVRSAAEALGELRDVDAVPLLIEQVRHQDQLVASSVRRALATITKQDFGASRWRWRTWWHANRERPRVEWLIDALNHQSGELSQAAVEELERLMSDEYVYHALLPREERERARKRFLAWQQNH